MPPLRAPEPALGSHRRLCPTHPYARPLLHLRSVPPSFEGGRWDSRGPVSRSLLWRTPYGCVGPWIAPRGPLDLTGCHVYIVTSRLSYFASGAVIFFVFVSVAVATVSLRSRIIRASRASGSDSKRVVDNMYAVHVGTVLGRANNVPAADLPRKSVNRVFYTCDSQSRGGRAGTT